MEEAINISFHEGNVTSYLAASFSPVRVIEELVANSMDEKSNKIIIIIDARSEKIDALDNGRGKSREKLIERWKQICQSLKTDPESLGTRGFGSLGGLGLLGEDGSYNHFTRDINDADDPFRCYTLEKSQLEKSRGIKIKISIIPRDPKSKKPVLKRVGRGGVDFQVNSLVSLRGVNKSVFQALKDIVFVANKIGDRWGERIRRRSIDIKVIFIDQNGRRSIQRVDPLRLRGEELEKRIIKTKFGDVTFEFTYSDKKLEKPPARISIQAEKRDRINVLNLIQKNQLSGDLLDIIHTGNFEGIITVDFCRLSPDKESLDTDEGRFEQVQMFSEAVERYLADELRLLVEKIRDESQIKTYQEVTKRAIDRVKKALVNIPDELRMKIASRIAISGVNIDGKDTTIGAASVIRSGKRKKKRGAGIRRRKEKKKDPVSTGDKKIENDVTPEQVRSTHYTRGLDVIWVKSDSESGFNWRSRFNQGRIELNLLNKDSRQIERRGIGALTDYTVMLILKEITCICQDEVHRSIVNDAFEDHFLGMMVNSKF